MNKQETLKEPKQIYYNTVGRENGKFIIKGQFNTQKEALDLANELNKKFPDLYYDWNETLIKEEPKQEVLEEAKQRAVNYMSLKGALEPKQETLEEAAKESFKNSEYLYDFPKYELGFIKGAKWQMDRMYSEEDMISFATFYDTHQGAEYWGKDLFKVWYNIKKEIIMNKEFIPYEQALALKELGFDEPCLGFYNHQGQLILMTQEDENSIQVYKNSYVKLGKQYAVPLYQQAFRWFREKHKLYHTINMFGDWDKPQYSYLVSGRTMNNPAHMWHFEDKDSHEEAELACLIKLIEIVKKK